MTEKISTPSIDPVAAAAKLPRKRGAGQSWSTTLAMLLLMLAVALGAALWWQQKRFDQSIREIAGQFQSQGAQLADAKRDARQATAMVDSHAGRIAQLERSVREGEIQYSALEQAWQTFNKGMDDAILASDVDRLLALASQQLKLAGNVNNAIVSLETALAMLVRADRPAFSGVQRAISMDLDVLRAVPVVDATVITARLESLLSLISRAPLLVPDAIVPGSSSRTGIDASSPGGAASMAANASPAAATASSAQRDGPSSDPAQSWWRHSLSEIYTWPPRVVAFLRKELAGVIQVQRVNDPSALLLSAEQAAQLRANLRSRVLTAQLALMMNQQDIWRTELAAIQQTLSSRFDPKSTDVAAAERLVVELIQTPVSVKLPDVSASLAALESARMTEKAATSSPKAGE